MKMNYEIKEKNLQDFNSVYKITKLKILKEFKK